MTGIFCTYLFSVIVGCNLVFIHGSVCTIKQYTERTVWIICGYCMATGITDFQIFTSTMMHVIEFLHFFFQFLQNTGYLFFSSIINNRHEFIPSISADKVWRWNRITQQSSKIGNHLITNRVSESVLDCFQVIQIEDNTSDRLIHDFRIIEEWFTPAFVR